MAKVDIILARHGETEENKMKILQGHLQGHLTELGKAQAERLADSLEGREIDVIVSSDLARSYDTAMAVASRRGMQPQKTELVREIDWGKFTGQPGNESLSRGTEETIETKEHLYERAGRFLDFLLERYDGKRVLVVGHGCINKAILAHANGVGIEGMYDIPLMNNADTISFEWTSEN